MQETLPFWLVVSSVPHYKSSSLYVLTLHGTTDEILYIFITNLEQLAMPSKLC